MNVLIFFLNLKLRESMSKLTWRQSQDWQKTDRGTQQGCLNWLLLKMSVRQNRAGHRAQTPAAPHTPTTHTHTFPCFHDHSLSDTPAILVKNGACRAAVLRKNCVSGPVCMFVSGCVSYCMLCCCGYDCGHCFRCFVLCVDYSKEGAGARWDLSFVS